jgi:hypothetical protein
MSNFPNKYKKVPLADALSRTTHNLDATEKTQVNSTITKFFELFGNKHM